MCAKCDGIAHRQRLEKPEELQNLFVQLTAAIREGWLLEWEEHAQRSSCRPLREVNAEGPWDDSVSHILECRSCGRLFGLSCGIYHGNGGFFDFVDFGTNMPTAMTEKKKWWQFKP